MKKKLSLSEIRPIYKLDIRKGIDYDLGGLFGGSYYTFDFDIVLNSGKNLQRDFVWSIEQKRSIVISVLKGLNIPSIAAIHYKDKDNKISLFKIVDGKQRLSSLMAFYNNEFAIIVNGVEYYYNDLEQDAVYNFLSFHLKFDIIYEYDDKRLSDEQLISWFELVNFAGTQQDIKHLENLKS